MARRTRPRVLFFGTLRANKGVEVLLDAIDSLAGTDVEFVVAGRGDAAVEQAVESAAARLPNLVAEVGWVSPERKTELYRSADLVVLPYTAFSSQSGVLHDAYGAHLPVVVTDVGALGDAVREHGTGHVVAPGDPVALAEALAVLATGDGAEWERCSAAAAQVAEDQSPANFAAGLRAVYRRVVDAAR